MTPYEAATALEDIAVPCFPCAADKSPLTATGFHAATVAHTAAAWTRAALVGVPTGEASGWDVIDVDVRAGGLAWLAANEHRLPETRRVQTRSGGAHLFFKASPGLRCSVGKIAPGVDCRAGGGFVIAWQFAGFPVEHADTVADWPAWLLEAAQGARTRHGEDPGRALADLAPPCAEAVVALLDRIPNPAEATRDDYIRVMMAAKGCIDGLAGDGETEIAEAAIGWAARWPGSPGYDAEAEKWDADFATRTAPLAGWPNLLAAAARLGVNTSAERAEGAANDFSGLTFAEPAAATPARLRMRDRLLRPADCESGPRRGYLIKHMIAPGDVAALIGAPGAGKSTLAPYLAYAVAQGRAVFGMRTKPGAVLYAAAEDVTGMRQRVSALKRIHGDAPDFALVDCPSLLDNPAAAADLVETAQHIKAALVVLDTVGAAWAGMDENDSAGMGAVVALARRIAATGAAVLLIHHTAKNGDGSPRGHSVLNGTLDMCLTLTPADEHRIVRGKLSKNRNGACDRDMTFRLDAHTLGVDEDGEDITAPVACELAEAVGPKLPALSPREQRALEILNTSDTGDGIADADWFEACEAQGLVASDSAANRRKVARQILQKLLDKQAVTASRGVLRSSRRKSAEQPGTRRNSAEQAGTDFAAVPRNSGTAGTATLKGCSVVPPDSQGMSNVAEGLI